MSIFLSFLTYRKFKKLHTPKLTVQTIGCCEYLMAICIVILSFFENSI